LQIILRKILASPLPAQIPVNPTIYNNNQIPNKNVFYRVGDISLFGLRSRPIGYLTIKHQVKIPVNQRFITTIKSPQQKCILSGGGHQPF